MRGDVGIRQKRVLVEYHHVAIVPMGQRTVGQHLGKLFTRHSPRASALLGRQWVVRGVEQFWPVVNTGRLVG